MKVYHLENAGTVDQLILNTTDQPVPQENEVLIKVKSISINPVDVKARGNDGVLNWIFQEQRPVVLGWDVSGEIEQLGKGVQQFELGDKVFGMLNFIGTGNAYTEYVIAPVAHIAKIPEGIGFEEAAGATLACLTALQVIRGRVQKGDKVLIHAGSGGVGHFAIQIAKHYGAYVIATSSAKNKTFIESLGADQHIDYKTQDFEHVLSDVDFVLDAIGGEVTLKSVRVIKNGGIVITLPSPDISSETEFLAKQKNAELFFYLVESNGADMLEIAQMLEKGIIRSEISHVFPFEQLKEAHLQVESGRTVGKVVVSV